VEPIMPRISILIPSITVSLLCLTAMINAASAADVYRYVDENGRVQYTDKPLKLPAERLNVQSQRTDTVAMEQRNEESANDDVVARDKERQEAAKKEAAKRSADAEFEANKLEACNKARSDYLSRMGTGRIYETLPNGERRYLESAEIDASRAAAKETMDNLCN
jgi:hypothetical protein